MTTIAQNMTYSTNADLDIVTKTGPPKGYRDGENNITDKTVSDITATTAAIRPNINRKNLTIVDDLKGTSDTATTMPKMKTTRIDTFYETDYDITSILTTTQRDDATTIPISTKNDIGEQTTVDGILTTTRTTTLSPLQTTTNAFDFNTFPLTTMTSAHSITTMQSSVTFNALPTTITTTIYPVTDKPDMTTTKFCTDITNCASNQFCINGRCVNKCLTDDHHEETNCFKGTHAHITVNTIDPSCIYTYNIF